MSPTNDTYVANSSEELVEALDNKAGQILITKFFKEEFIDKTELPLSETEEMGFNLGSAGTASIAGNLIYMLLNRFGKEDETQKRINEKVKQYNVFKQEEDLLLRLRQLDY